jgi:hypothetical protein
LRVTEGEAGDAAQQPEERVAAEVNEQEQEIINRYLRGAAERRAN